jgi:hypothetical protein
MTSESSITTHSIRWPLGNAVVRESPDGKALFKRYEDGEINLERYRSDFDTLAFTLEV